MAVCPLLLFCFMYHYAPVLVVALRTFWFSRKTDLARTRYEPSTLLIREIYSAHAHTPVF